MRRLLPRAVPIGAATCRWSSSTVPPSKDPLRKPATCPFTAPAEQPGRSGILGFESPVGSEGVINQATEHRPNITHYGTYLGIETLLNLQSGPAHAKPGGEGIMHHEENMFVIVHQVFELWFKLVLADLRKIRELLMGAMGLPCPSAETIAPRAPQSAKTRSAMALLKPGSPPGDVEAAVQRDFYTVSNLLSRVEMIIVHATNGGFQVMETMHPSDFLEFRDFLVPASGFQSASFRVLEGMLGVSDGGRAVVNGKPVKEYLDKHEQELVKSTCAVPSMASIVNRLLSSVNVPDAFMEDFLKAVRVVASEQQFKFGRMPEGDATANDLIETTVTSMKDMLADPASYCDDLKLSDAEREAFRASFFGALFVTVYREEPRFAMLAKLLDQAIGLEEAVLLWRGRHMHMAERMLGRRMGTGGSSGVGYLDFTRKYRVFHVLWMVRLVAVRSSAMPPLEAYGASLPMFKSGDATPNA